MNKKITIPVVVLIAAVAIVSVLYSNGTKDQAVSEIPLSYDSNSKIQSLLATEGITMSNPLKFKGDSIQKYCKFFSDEDTQDSIQYCTSTEITDSEGNFVGNIHMVGNTDSPFAVLGIMQTDPFMSQIDSVKTVTEAMVESLVCDCWKDKKPGGIESVSDWIDMARSHHLDAKKTTSKSETDGLGQKHLLIEISTNTEGYLWKFIITN